MKQSPLLLEEELQYVKNFVILPVILDVLERDIKTLGNLQLKMPEIYIRILQSIQNMVLVDLTKIKKISREQGIKVYEQHRTNRGMEASYLCRGYHHTMVILWSIVRTEIKMRLCLYMGLDITGGATS